MNGHRKGGFRVPGGGVVAITGGTRSDREDLLQRFEAAGLTIPIETTADATEPASGAAAGVGGVVRLSPSDGEETDTVSVPGDDTYLIVVGANVDVAAAYEAGASQVVPIAVADLPDGAVDRMVTAIRREWDEAVATALLDQAPVGVILHDPGTGEILAHNERCADLLGVSPEVVGLSDVAACSGSTRSALIAAIEGAAEGGEPTVELSDTSDRASVDALEGRFEPATVGGERFVVGWFSDVTERTRQREQLERYETILDSLDDAVYATAPDGTIEYVNAKYVSMKGADREELLGTSIYEWANEETAERAKGLRRQIRAGDQDVGSLEYEFRSVDGATTPAEIRFVEMSRDAEATGGAGVIRDISDRRSYERRLERQNERLKQFASVVSHDLRNPLNVAAGRLDLAREVCDTEHLDDVADAHDRMAELIEDLLMLAREGDDIRDLEPVDLTSLAEVCWGTVETDNATIDVDIDRPIRADRGRLQQLLENVIRNSVEHGSTDSHSRASEDGVRITIGALDDGSGFYLEDDGPGIPPEQRESVFEMGNSTDPDGTGFGLSIVEQIAEAHGWSVRITNADNGGARFEFSGVDFDLV